jgi:hypothetical protein
MRTPPWELDDNTMGIEKLKKRSVPTIQTQKKKVHKPHAQTIL